ncbi:unnamed protein product [Pleuronectes platessa]|uniref:Uncharacterized protein n=1 Tax=Pleuronectes platessa TaxID=8262 RepID=A0A9N7YUN1_PLEPL|nr:unnamed protein product [Pleuronectes platessa]
MSGCRPGRQPISSYQGGVTAPEVAASGRTDVCSTGGNFCQGRQRGIDVTVFRLRKINKRRKTPCEQLWENNPLCPRPLSAISDELTLTGPGSVIAEAERTRTTCSRRSSGPWPLSAFENQQQPSGDTPLTESISELMRSLHGERCHLPPSHLASLKWKRLGEAARYDLVIVRNDVWYEVHSELERSPPPEFPPQHSSLVVHRTEEKQSVITRDTSLPPPPPRALRGVDVVWRRQACVWSRSLSDSSFHSFRNWTELHELSGTSRNVDALSGYYELTGERMFSLVLVQ